MNKPKGIKETIQSKIAEAAGINPEEILQKLAPIGAIASAAVTKELEDLKNVIYGSAELIARAQLASRFVVHTNNGPEFHKSEFEQVWESLQQDDSFEPANGESEG